MARGGFDLAGKSRGGALGKGIYFADTSALSDAYALGSSQRSAGSDCASGGPAAAEAGGPAGPAWVPGCKAMLLCLVRGCLLLLLLPARLSWQCSAG